MTRATRPAGALLCLLGLAAPAAAAPAAFDCEPSVRVLQEAALRAAALEPSRTRSALARIRGAAALPTVRARLGRGLLGLTVAHGSDGLDRVTPTVSDTWRFELEATWSLDRLVFDRAEVGLLREAQRVAARREALLLDVARLYFERRRLQLAAPPSGEEAVEQSLAIAELGAALDGLTDGALTARSTCPPSSEGPPP